MKKLEILIDKKIYRPGESVTGTVILRNDKPIKIRNIRLEIIGLEKTSITVSHGKSSTTYHDYNYLLNIKTNLENRNELPPGEYRYPIEFQVPLNSIPTYSGRNASVYYLIKARADIPLWFDIKTQKSFWIFYHLESISKTAKPVKLNSEHFSHVLDTPRLSTGVFNFDKPKPGFLVELDKDTFLAGETIIGKITITNPTQKKLRKIDVLLRAKEYAYAKGHRRYVTVEKHKDRIKIDDIIEGLPSRFEITIPRKARTSYLGLISKCEWFLELNLDVVLAFDEKVRLPIAIYQWR